MKFLELILWILGGVMLLLFVGIVGWQEVERRHEIAAFVDLQRNIAVASSRAQAPTQSSQQSLQTRNAPQRPSQLAAPAQASTAAPALKNSDVTELARATLNTPDGVPIAILRIPSIGLVVPVNIGTGTSELRRGAGLLTSSPLPGAAGNVAIAAHRDSFFRGLKDVSVSDTIELDTLGRTLLYRITKLTVVQPTDVDVLADVGEPVLTLITCYPFYFVGHAPERFIVRAVATNFRR